MMIKKTLGLLLLVFAVSTTLVHTGNAQDARGIQDYFSQTAVKVKATVDPVQKRAMMDRSLQSMVTALERVNDTGLVSAADAPGIDRLRASLIENQDELAGRNGFAPVPDSRLNAFADYVVQGMEQAEKTITIGLVAALLIIIIVILL